MARRTIVQPVILAFLQNQWFRNPAYVATIYARHVKLPEDRADLNARFLFMRQVRTNRMCLTGEKLFKHLGETVCDRIVWENGNPGHAGESTVCLPADVDHIGRVIQHFKPAMVISFGAVARKGVTAHFANMFNAPADLPVFLSPPHPAARGDQMMVDRSLIALRGQIEAFIAYKAAST